ncbi:hypothetical protein FOZ62_003320 [Perkinsus olseni]|uniref:DNA primase large subunit C-terminal domain-containing protein n=1 Tax=Perkinsus olseni TaxID=32597 RepID=A0A7J6TJS5_PEROL|nr:hypothetical protein FOZ62_003320 [Perkinsus olseni]
MSIPSSLMSKHHHHQGSSSSSSVGKSSFEDDNDITSHFMLRLAFCRSPELSNWFIKCEELLLQCVLHYYGQSALTKALQQTGVSNLINRVVGDTDMLPRHPTGDGKTSLVDMLRKATLGCNGGHQQPQQSSTTATTFYEIPFMYCSPHLISRRAVVIIGGMAYIPDTQLSSLLCKTYREELREHLRVALQERAVFMNDPRIASIVQQMHPTYRPSNGNSMDNLPDSEKLSLDNFNLLLERSFPPCMRNLIEQMRQKKTHLKHRGRQQLPPFLRAAGLNMDDSLRWFKTEFTRDQSIDPDKFDRHYSYDIKWVYGKVGRMKPAQALSCSTILGFEYPTAQQIHGCPFKTMDDSVLRKTLSNWAERAGCSQQQSSIMIEDITKKSKREGQLACQEWFRVMHPGSSGDGVGNHPNSYFSESIAYHLPKDGRNDAEDKMENADESV